MTGPEPVCQACGFRISSHDGEVDCATADSLMPDRYGARREQSRTPLRIGLSIGGPVWWRPRWDRRKGRVLFGWLFLSVYVELPTAASGPSRLLHSDPEPTTKCKGEVR